MENEQGQPANQAPPVDYGPYSNPQELLNGYRASSSEAQRLKAELDALRSQAANPRMEIPQRSASPLEELETLGIPTRALDAVIQDRLTQAFAPLAQQIQGQQRARQHMLSTYGQEYVKFQPEVAQFVGSDPVMNETYTRMSAADPVAAEEWAYLRFGEVKRRQNPEPQPRDKAKATEHSIPTSRQGDARNGPSQEQEMVEAAREQAFKTGSKRDIERFGSMRLRQAISKRFYDSGHPG
jgi:hypothetical protein